MTAFKPGFYEHMDAAVYHADPCTKPSLSSSIAKILIEKTPAHARFAHPRLNPNFKPTSTTKAMDLGSVVHEIVLGKGGGLEISPYDSYTTKAARQWRDDVIAERLIPIKAAEFGRATQMADAVAACVAGTPGAERAFIKGHGESVVIWEDVLDVHCRAMIDWFDEERLAVYDLKTTGLGLSDRAIQRAIAGGHDLQAAFHIRGLERTIKPPVGIAWRWVFVEDEEPFECRIIEMDGNTRTFGERKALWAINAWHACMESDDWPGYARKVERSNYPEWAEATWLDREAGRIEST